MQNERVVLSISVTVGVPRPGRSLEKLLSFPDEGIAVNSWNVLVKINNTGAALGVPLHFKSHSFSLLFFFNLPWAGRSGNSKHCVLGGWLAEFGRKVNQSNVPSRSRALSPSPQSARVFQPPQHKTCVQGKVTGAGPS